MRENDIRIQNSLHLSLRPPLHPSNAVFFVEIIALVVKVFR